MHPRLSHMLLRAVSLHLVHLASDIAAIISERDIVRGSPGWRNADLRLRLDVLHGRRDQQTGVTVDRAACQRVKRTAELWQRYIVRHVSGKQMDAEDDPHAAGRLLALAFPIESRRPTGGDAVTCWRTPGALFSNPDPLAAEPYLVIANLDAGTQWGRIDLAILYRLRYRDVYADTVVNSEQVPGMRGSSG